MFGAAGSVGSRIVGEALLRGHEVTAVVRDESRLSSLPAGARGRIGDATSVDQVAALSAGQDLVISATRPAPGNEQQLVTMAKSLLAGVTRSGVRLLLVGGAASLKVPDTGGLLVDDARYVPDFVRDIAIACCAQFDVCTADAAADWTYLSPPALLVPGERTGGYRSGGDELLFDSDGTSTISIEDFAVALLDEAESPKHRRSRFTVAAHASSVCESEVMVRTPDGVADCYFVHPVSGAYPGVILWPDALGLRLAFRTIGKRLARSGYSVLVINPYYRHTVAPIRVDADAFNEPAGREKVLSLANAITPDMTMTDAVALAGFLAQHKSVDPERKLGTMGYCIGGAMAVRTAAAVNDGNDRNDRVGAIASFHGANLVTQQADSPHLLVPRTRASALIGIAENDDAKDPDAKALLREAYAKASLAAEIEVYPGTMHGWCALDTKAYDRPHAERAWSRLLALFSKALA
ncbi:Dienelactone hydrolase [Labilithrix luteola]|uniref:Dienelactone hydrolase n=1 Tax=Labilithrix luteola TaxID=1391654 RepID=A0A0K1PNA5_9BACT|nr:dienelactone hydrolase family protein [Labilithrix luteola]AKU94594.1 Dienelactone hydrolase [Labilithrix luteola]